MDQELVRALIAPAATAVVTALVAALGVAINDWRQRRNTATRYRQTIADGSQLLGFVRDWMATQEKVIDPEDVQRLKAEVRQTTEHIYREVERAERMHLAAEAERQNRKKASTRVSFRGVLLLGIVPSSPLRRVAKGLYQLVLGFALLILVTTVFAPVSDPGESRVAAMLYTIVGVVLIFILPLIFLRWLVFRSPRASDGHPPTTPTTVATPEGSQSTRQP